MDCSISAWEVTETWKTSARSTSEKDVHKFLASNRWKKQRHGTTSVPLLNWWRTQEDLQATNFNRSEQHILPTPSRGVGTYSIPTNTLCPSARHITAVQTQIFSPSTKHKRIYLLELGTCPTSFITNSSKLGQKKIEMLYPRCAKTVLFSTLKIAPPPVSLCIHLSRAVRTSADSQN